MRRNRKVRSDKGRRRARRRAARVGRTAGFATETLRAYSSGDGVFRSALKGARGGFIGYVSGSIAGNVAYDLDQKKSLIGESSIRIRNKRASS